MNASQSSNQATVYQNEYGIVAVGSDRSCVGHLVADIQLEKSATNFVARSPAMRLSGKGSEPVDSVERLGFQALEHLFFSMKQQGSLDNALSGWSRSSHSDRFEAERMIHVFCQKVAMSARAVFSFSVRENIGHSRAENVNVHLLSN